VSDSDLSGSLFELRKEFLGLKSEIAAQKFMRAGWRAVQVLGKFNPDQPRDDQGRWTEVGGGDSSAGSDGELILTGSGGYPVELLEEEGLGGHAIERHVAKPEEYLKARILGSRTNIAGILTFGEARAGSFTSLEAANKLVNSTLSQNQDKVEAFVEGRFPSSLPFVFLFAQFDSPTGYEAYARNPRSHPVMRSTSGVTVLIRRSDRSDKGYYVETAWPMNED
jgi:hypothetical protein